MLKCVNQYWCDFDLHLVPVKLIKGSQLLRKRKNTEVINAANSWPKDRNPIAPLKKQGLLLLLVGFFDTYIMTFKLKMGVSRRLIAPVSMMAIRMSAIIQDYIYCGWYFKFSS